MYDYVASPWARQAVYGASSERLVFFFGNVSSHNFICRSNTFCSQILLKVYGFEEMWTISGGNVHMAKRLQNSLCHIYSVL